MVAPTQGATGSTIEFSYPTTATLEQFIAGLTDFGPGRSEVFADSTDEYLTVHSLGADCADVTEGSRGIWERLRYDWSDPSRITMRTTDSNLWGGASGHTYGLTPQPDGTKSPTRLSPMEARAVSAGSSEICTSRVPSGR